MPHVFDVVVSLGAERVLWLLSLGSSWTIDVAAEILVLIGRELCYTCCHSVFLCVCKRQGKGERSQRCSINCNPINKSRSICEKAKKIFGDESFVFCVFSSPDLIREKVYLCSLFESISNLEFNYAQEHANATRSSNVNCINFSMKYG